MKRVDCETIREALSARADGEATREDIAVADAHLTHCPACRSLAADLERVDRMVRIRPAEPVPNLVASVTARARPARLGRGGWLRPALASVAVVMLVQSLPARRGGAVDAQADVGVCRNSIRSSSAVHQSNNASSSPIP